MRFYLEAVLALRAREQENNNVPDRLEQRYLEICVSHTIHCTVACNLGMQILWKTASKQEQTGVQGIS